MTLAPFYAAPLFVKAHILGALVVVVLTPLQFWGLSKGSLAHRTSGYLWLGAMLVVALSSFYIPSVFAVSFAGFGPIHLLSVFALYSIFTAIRYARAGNIRGHRLTLIGLAIGFWIAGVFTLVPPRMMWRIVAG